MPALNFMAQFQEPIRSGRKILTMRAERKDGRDPARLGTSLKLFTGMRSKHVRLIMEAPVIFRCLLQFGRGGPLCMGYDPAPGQRGSGLVHDHFQEWLQLDVGAQRDAMSDQVAQWDGFENWAGLWAFHGPDADPRLGWVSREVVAWEPPA